MYLKRLEMQGFKSFPEKIKLEFNKGITAVVGPNGSGKSNIADAVRWVLGEKSAKNLRGSKMEDVIFNGTANRKPLGFAEVSLILDNSDRKLNIDYSEVTVTRRVYRSGESDYIINGTKCRAKDILELFMDTGVGKEGYSIVGQGRIDEILSTKSEDRRHLFEEAAGIVKYRTRCTEATNKLNKERENLIRVNDIIDELEKQVGPLEVQAEKAKKCIILSDKLKLVRINIFVRDAAKFENEINELDKQITQLNSDIATEVENEKKLTEKKSGIKNEISDIENKLEQITEDIGNKRSEREQKENDVKLCQQSIDYLNENIERINSENKTGSKTIEEKEDSIVSVKKEIEEKSALLQEKKKTYDEKIKVFSELSTQVSEREELLNRYNSDVIAKMNKATDVKNEISKTEAMLVQLDIRREQLDGDTAALEIQQGERNAALSEAQKEMDRAEKAARLNIENIDKMTEQYNKLLENTQAARQRQSDVNRAIQEKNSRLRILSELEKSYEGYYDGVKAVLAQRDSKNADFKGICGAVGEIINLDKKYETAIEVALGSAVQNIIARTEEDVKKAINFLKKNNKGRATFLPMTAIKPKTMGAEKYNILKEKGVLGIAKELIDYSREYENIMSSLLERVIVADNIDNAVDLAKKTKYAYKIVTLEGELINAGGSMTGGSMHRKTASIFSRGREIATLREELKALYEEQAATDADVEKMSEICENLDYKITEAKDELQDINIRKTEAAAKIDQAQEYAEDINTRLENARTELSELTITIENGNEEKNKLNIALGNINAEIEEINNKLNEFQSLIQSDRDTREASNEEIAAMRVELNQLENDIYTLNSDADRISEEITALRNSVAEGENSIAGITEEISRKQNEMSELTNVIEALRTEYEDLFEEQERFYSRKSDKNNALDEVEKDIKNQLETKTALERELDRLELRKTNTDEKSRALYDSMWEEYEITYVTAKMSERLDMSDSELKSEEKKLRNQIKALGNVNLNAVDEYAEVKERYDFLTKNRDDILETEKKLVTIIDDLNSMMEKQFTEQFALISKNFKQTFSEMFGGGVADLKLADGEDILNCGIDIIVQPPGKTLQNMMLLSGGEKALTAMALLFAILKMKPSPFCILDEIEAALDDANVVRYADYLSNFTDDTQFIVITHRKGTMEAADILYGVTMQEQGISKLVSVKFNERGVI